jgi:PPOX class probable F420-dependent enzyme
VAKLDRKTVNFISRPLFGKMATVTRNGSPHVTPIWYMYEDGKVLVNTAEDRVKFKNVKRDGRVAFLIDDGYSYVLIRGTAKIAPGRDAKKDIETIAVRYLGEKQGRKQTRDIYSKQKRATIEIVPEKVILNLP